ncbi:MAG: NUDIX domain-containing protein [Patescibacteria group bacterium]
MSQRYVVPASEAPGLQPGWSAGEGDIVFQNLKVGVQVVHVAWIDENDAGDKKVLYDQILRCEPGGGVSVVVDTAGRIGLQKAHRPNTRNQDEWKNNWPKLDLTLLGRSSWELPRGFANINPGGQAESGADAAVRETEEETGSKVTSSRALGYVSDNTASSPHLTAMQMATVDLDKPSGAAPDRNEKLLSPLTFFTKEEVKSMVDAGDIYCGFTLAGIAKWLLN